MKFFLELSYNGTSYHGWQVQPNARTVQQEIDIALSKIFKGVSACTGSGRTDTGVHALGQVCHFEAEELITTEKILYKLNAVLPHDIAIREVRRVTDNAHARFDALDRTYHYFIHRKKDPFRQNLSYLTKQTLDTVMMNQASALLVGLHDFQCFSKVHTDVSNFNCTIEKAFWQEEEDGLRFIVTANRFLRNMVRAIVGTMLDVGCGKTDISTFKKIIASKDRNMAGKSAPAHGLYLVKVNYPDHIYVN